MRMTTPTTEVRMRGDDLDDQGVMWSYVPMERRIPADHPLRHMRNVVLTPHIGWPTDQGYARFAEAVADVVLAFGAGGEVPRFEPRR